MKRTLITTCIFSLLLLTNVKAQDSTTVDSNKVKPFQLTYVYPLGTNGLEAYKIKNKVSLNILVGVSSGVTSFEGAGIGNLTNGNVTGTQLAGLFNLNKGDVRGGQFSGLINAVDGDFKGGQFSGFANVNTGRFKGAQFSGFANVNAENMKGGQYSGFSNTVVGNLDGFQASGYVNVVTDTLEGTQLSGLVNYAEHVKGYQIGFININDTISKGIPIGFFSYSKKGYHKLEIEASNLPFASANFKTGVKQFYNIFSISGGTSSDDIVGGIGYGIGTLFSLGNKLDMNIDLTTTQLYKENVDEEKINLLNKLKVNVAYNISDKVQVYGGPSLDILVHDKTLDSEVKDSFKEWNSTSTLTKATVSFNAGIRF